MTRAAASLPAGYFDTLYAHDPDPWGFDTSDYERRKYAHTLAVLRDRYDSALEVGCSIGVLTALLAPRCGHLLALEPAALALARARERTAAFPQVALRQAMVPAEWPVPPAGHDLILLSEVLYFLDRDDLDRLALLVAAALRPGADLLLVHWTGETDYPLSGDEAVERLIATVVAAGQGVMRVLRRERRPEYRLDLLRREPRPADARRGGS
ncbi:nodulation S family protein [Roseomonas sp. NAR14]|uniref:Nodulation S family protein n=1 Tax=Roseomonas acroporae TaxID=2937791 RepID=A0A9X2BUW1_9PROT|nr:SAM-dependent methyltransferase [Roseomonas acroporae]MCK8783374.1 nodulation S family protein [Roseomonas acroporae]